MRFDGKKPIEFSDDTVKLEQENLEETKYVLKGNAPSTDSSVEGDEDLLDALDASEPSEGDGDLGGLEDVGGELELDDKPFDDEPFDAGIEADEDTDPQKYIQQLSGKLGQSLRQYSEDEGQPDFDLEKFAVNSVLSATHTGEMDTEDQRDIINKVKGSGKEDPEDEDLDVEDEDENPNDSSMDDGSNNNGDVNFGAEAPMENSMMGSSLQESEKNNKFIEEGDSMFGNDENFTNDDVFGKDKRWSESVDPIEEGGRKEYQKNPNSNVMWHDSDWGSLPERLPVGTKFSANGKMGVVLSDYMDGGGPLVYKVKYNDGTDGSVGSTDPTLNILQESEKNGKFVTKTDIMEAIEPLVEPVIKPTVKPDKPRRERELDRPFLPKRKDKLNPDPKGGEAIHEVGGNEDIEFNGRTVLLNSIDIEGINYTDWPDFSDAFISSATYDDGTPLDDIELSTFQDENDTLVNWLIFDKQLYL